jgi:hypothetical protein
MFADLTDIREVWLELVADAGEVGLYGTWLDVMRHINDEETDGVWRRVDGEVV